MASPPVFGGIHRGGTRHVSRTERERADLSWWVALWRAHRVGPAGKSIEEEEEGRWGPAARSLCFFGSSIVQFSYSNGGWGAILADVYARKVLVAMPNDAIPSLPPMPKIF
ncbi:hypothetical protein B296_00005648 [Ensete ventricosum]|uniref:Uncharacterized protein n=1 Tax=Ensete ventricosum TaxID=4639 RepID=A0A427AMY4_ENSVE|nr:hypothetical protein B296_00005648 [Ensete ventricosum]